MTTCTYDLSLLLANPSNEVAVLPFTSTRNSRTANSIPFHGVQSPEYIVGRNHNADPASPRVTPENVSPSNPSPTHNNSNSSSNIEPALVSPTDPVQPNNTPDAPVSPSYPNTPSPQQQIVTHGQARKIFPRKFTDGTFQYNPNRRAFFVEPTSHKTALSQPKWRLAMEAEFNALQKNKTWVLVPYPYSNLNKIHMDPFKNIRHVWSLMGSLNNIILITKIRLVMLYNQP